MKLNHIDQTTCKILRERINAALAPLAAELGMKIEARNATFTTSSMDIKVSCAVIADGGNAMTSEAERFKNNAVVVGLRPELLFQKFQVQGREWMVVGMTRTLGRLPILCQRDGGSVFKVSVDFVHKGFAGKEVK